MTTTKDDDAVLAAILERNKGFFGENARPGLSYKASSPDGNHTVYQVRYWNGYLMCTALFVDNKMRYWCAGMTSLTFSSDSKWITVGCWSAEDPTMAGPPDRRETKRFSLVK